MIESKLYTDAYKQRDWFDMCKHLDTYYTVSLPESFDKMMEIYAEEVKEKDSLNRAS